MRRLLLAAGLTTFGIVPAMAAPIELSGRVDARAGYGSNPFLRPNDSSGSTILGFDINPVLRKTFATGSTSLSGAYSREFYLGNEGDPDTAQIVLQHTQQLNPRLSVNASASYSSSSNALGSFANSGLYNSGFYNTGSNNTGTNTANAADPSTGIGLTTVPLTRDYVDPLTIGARTRRYQGDVSFGWRPSLRDTFSASGGYAHGLSNLSQGIGSYNFYVGSVSYSRSVGGRMQIGARMGYNRTDSQTAETVSSYEPSVILTYQFSEIWSFDSNIGATIRRVPSLGETSTGLGFNANLCGTYPKTSICVSGSRITSASGFGGARINTNLGITLSHQLTSRDRASLNVSYVDSKPVGRLPGLAQQFTQANAGFDHRIGTRLVVGIDGRFQTRTQDLVSDAQALSVTARIGYLFGRVS